MNVLVITGAATICLIRNIGRMSLFFFSVLKLLFTSSFCWRMFGKQLLEVGYYSLPVVGLTAIFTGAVLALQSYTGFARMNATSAIASVVALSIVRELGPVLAGLMLSGRISAAIAAEIGSMKVTEQLDALYTLGTNPLNYLVIPRIIAGMIALPCLVIVADVIGIFGGYLVAVYKLDFAAHLYLSNTIHFITASDISSGLIKAVVFGFIVTFIGCFFGFYTDGGAQGVGNSTTSAVVVSSILILLINYIITGLLFYHLQKNMSRQSKISISNLSTSFDGVRVLHNISIEVKASQALVIIGGSGSGKSVMLKLIMGILQPDSGSKVVIDGQDMTFTHIKDRHQFVERFGMLFQGSALFDSLPIWHNICFQMLQSNKISKERARVIAAEKLRLVDISPNSIDLYPSQFSGGMQKRVALARAIANDPSVIFFDEPTAGLDPINAEVVSALISNLSQNLKATTITVTHDMLCMKKIADYIVALHKGQLIWKGSKEEIGKSDNSYLKAFINASGNIIQRVVTNKKRGGISTQCIRCSVIRGITL